MVYFFPLFTSFVLKTIYSPVSTIKKYGMILLFFISLVICALSVSKFILCCKDYKYFSTGTYIEVTGTVVDYMDIKRDYDGNKKQ